MIRLAARAVLVLAVAVGQQPQRDATAPPRTGTAVLSGTVVTNDRDAQPIRRARVVLNGAIQSESQVATTDDTGRFVFRGVPSGRYTLQAAKPPFLPMQYGATRAERPGTPIAVADGQTISTLTIRMTRGAALEGRVLDWGGEPMSGTLVAAVRHGYSATTGERLLTAVGHAVTDDRGVYRLFGLAPAEYFIVASPTLLRSSGRDSVVVDARRLTAADVDRVLQGSSRNDQSGASSAAPVNWAPVYYPGSPEPAGATKTALDAGEERTGLDIAMRLFPTSLIGGVVTTPPGVSPSRVRVTLTAADPQARVTSASLYVSIIPDPLTGARLNSMGLGFSASTTPSADGRYAFVGVPPGSYVVNARVGRAGALGRGGVQGPAEPLLWASASVGAQGVDLDVPLTLQPALPLSGRVVLKTTTPAKPAEIADLRLALRAVDGGADVTWAQATELGTFTFDGAVPGLYRFTWTKGPGPDLFPTSLTVRGREMLDGPIEISSPIDDMTAVFTDRPSEITGTLQDATGRPATDYFIVVFPVNRAYWTAPSRRVMQTRPGSDGSYVLRNLPAGEYLIAALTDVAPGDTSDPAFLSQLVAMAAKVTVADGATVVRPFRIGG